MPDVNTFNCTTSVIEETTLNVTCIPPPHLQFIELLCAVDCGILQPCDEDRVNGNNETVCEMMESFIHAVVLFL